MQIIQRGFMGGRTFLVAVAVLTMAACDQSGNPLTPIHRGRAAELRADVNIVRRPAVFHGTPMTREEARKKGIETARAALARARAGAVTGLSDGRKLTGAAAVRLWERTLRALESGSSLTHVWGTADASSDAGTASTEDGYGYVWGYTSLSREWSYAIVNSLTIGDGAESTYIEGDFEVFLSSTRSTATRSEYAWYVTFAKGDFAATEVQVNWDYNWMADFALATTRHAANYGGYDAWTTSSAAN